MKRGLIALPALAFLSDLAYAQTAQSRYTELVGGRCRFVSIDRETNEDQVKRCPGHGGAEVETRSSHTRLFVSFRFSKSQVAKDVVAAWSAGKTLEWRGPKTNKGFQPYAAILRLLMKDPESETREADGEVLALIRVDPREAEACAMAFIDARANKDANALARVTADGLGPEFDCRSDKPQVAGARTRWTAALVEGKQP
jgi:hypothetical protein